MSGIEEDKPTSSWNMFSSSIGWSKTESAINLGLSRWTENAKSNIQQTVEQTVRPKSQQIYDNCWALFHESSDVIRNVVIQLIPELETNRKSTAYPIKTDFRLIPEVRAITCSDHSSDVLDSSEIKARYFI
jgi:hypothetical protein